MIVEGNEEMMHSSNSGTPNKQISRKFSVAVCLVVTLTMCVFWLITSYNTRNLLQQQANELGQALAQQTATLLTELVLANDLISINVVLANLTQDSSIAEIAVLNIGNNVIAEAVGSPAETSTLIPLPLHTIEAEYLAPISLADSVAGSVRVRLDLSYIEAGTVNNLLLVMVATILLVVASWFLSTTYYQYLVSFPANLLAFSLGNIRSGKIETCPEPENSNEISTAIRQFNATAEFLAQNTLLEHFTTKHLAADTQNFKVLPSKQESTLLVICLSNFQYLASTVNEEDLVKLLNKFYFYAGKVVQLYNGTVNYCAEGEMVISFDDVQQEEEQAFYAICAAQLFLLVIGNLGNTKDEHFPSKFRLAVHSGQVISGLYSPITRSTNNPTGRTLDLLREICSEAPDNSVLISELTFEQAGASTRVEAKKFSMLSDGEPLVIYLGLAPKSDYALLLERQAIQLVTMYSDD